MKHFEIVGLPDKAVEESKERVSLAISSSGFKNPQKKSVRVLVSLAPADLKKEGSLYDLPIALAYLLAEREISFDFREKIFLGELALDGRLRPVKGAVAFAILAKEKGFKEIILPKENVKEAGLIEGIKVIGGKNLREVIDYLEGRKEIPAFKTKKEEFLKEEKEPEFNLDLIAGQESAKRALEIAAAGSHNLSFLGPPGVGKTILAKSLISILPPLSFEESLEVTKIYSVSGLLSIERPLITQPPFRSPHHTSSEVALIGGGNPPRPGEITLAHLGVLFLDEFPEFHRDLLESLRQPVEEGKITILRSKTAVTFPAQFILILSSNPCPCGNLGNPQKSCSCSNSQIRAYQRKLSGPLMDRIDLNVFVPPLKYEKLVAKNSEKLSMKIKERVKLAREIQRERFKGEKISTNSRMTIPQIKKYCQIDQKSEALLKRYVNAGKLSVRGYHRVLKVARTIADLDQSEKISFSHLSEALVYRLRED